ncbi:MAG TPA: single-stranded-DNA-specific exonuclease RecJ [Candidatus Paceibacterota bacterium]|nr:single-stranded-DNA-specific exonuclease RecJ [Candidatus Paceibacterota bacterium]HMP19040.1 single-stranded-DNA-specific exonuclease RecJ [Candidatus Paceibacterota bacterium]HMP85195.1 single-stranded-DNA-specific exonuclease RecJ [Candidatus Paceibacterota bacterium]
MSYKILPQITQSDRKNLNKYSDILAHLLYHRGFKDVRSAEEFLNINYELNSGDPFLLKDIQIATDRIFQAIFENQKICIYSDYDADGIPGAVILSDFFDKINFKNFFVYIPHRNREGFGLNFSAIKKITEEKANLIITIDCGITDVDQIEKAVLSGIDVIVTDHHDPNDHVSKALAVINPKQKDCKYSDKNICGSGVIFKVVQALILKGREKILKDENFILKDNWPNIGWEKWLLDMVGIATLSDMVPLVGENRIFAKYGLLVMRKSPRKGFRRLLKECKIDQNLIVEDDVGFSISPRINAASRMGEPEIAYKMLFTKDDHEAELTVKHLHKINDERKGVVASMVKEIKKDFKEMDFSNKKIIVKGNPNWSPSLLGLAASNIVETYNKPVFLWGRGEGTDYKGSCRSNGEVNLVDLMNNVPDGIIGEYGGHMMAGGFVVKEKGIFDLDDGLQSAYEKVKNHDVESDFVVDAEITLEDINFNFFNEVQKLAPFGVGNEKPLFLLKNLRVDEVSYFGKEKKHLKLIFKKKDGKKISAIKFFALEEKNMNEIKSGQNVDLLVNIEKSNFGRITELRLRIVDFM